MYTKGDKIEVQCSRSIWDNMTYMGEELYWVPGTFVSYAPALDGETAKRINAKGEDGRVWENCAPACIRLPQPPSPPTVEPTSQPPADTVEA